MRVRIRAKRLKLKLSQSELARRVGISRVAVCEYEAGRGSLSDRTIEKMLDVLDIDVKRRARLALRRTIAELERKAS
jgi:transcriptional regulator with XRE-family HTH domain